MLLSLKRLLIRYGRGWPLIWRVSPQIRSELEKYLRGQNIPRVVDTKYNFRLHVNLGDFIGRHIWLNGDYERPVCEIVENILRPGFNAIDVGANIGFYSLLFSTLVGENGKVFSYEASPNIYRDLISNIQLNNISNIEACNKAIGSKKGSAVFYQAVDSNLGKSSLRNLGDQTSHEIDVEVMTLNVIIDQLPPIHLIKIDVEGAEMIVLQGISEILERDKPYIIIEVTDNFLQQMGSDRDTLLEWLRSKSYSLYEVYGGMLKILPSENFRNQFNVIAVPEGKKLPDYEKSYL